MPTIVVTHDVKDTGHWLASPKREEFFGPRGITDVRTFVDPGDPARVAVMLDVPDLDALRAEPGGEEAAQAMAHDGVLPETLKVSVER